MTLLFTYSGIDRREIEPYSSHVAADSLKLMSAQSFRRYRTVLYWRPLVPGLNDTDQYLARARELSEHADATVFTGLFYRDQIAEYCKQSGIPEPYDLTVCDICPLSQLELCRGAHRIPSAEQVHDFARALPEAADLRVRTGGHRGRPGDRATALLPSPRARLPGARRTPPPPREAAWPRRHWMDGDASMTHWTTLNYVVVDVEGNGQQPPDLVELAAVPIVNGIVGEPKTWLVKPDELITGFARRIHGISNEDVFASPLFAYVEADVLKALDASALIAHNAHIDVGVLQRKLGDWECPEVFDTLKLARRLLPGRASYKLGALVDEFDLANGLDETLQPHRAGYDAIVTARLFVQIAGRRSLEELRDQPSGGVGDEEPALF